MLSRLRIRNFKSWVDTDEMRLAPITILFGANNSGKSSITQLLLMLNQTADSPDYDQVLHLGDERSLVELGTFPEMIHGHDVKRVLSWEMAWKHPKSNDSALKDVFPRKVAKSMLFSGKELEYSAQIKWREAKKGRCRIMVEDMGYRFGGRRFGMRPAGEGNDEEYVLEVTNGSCEKPKTVQSRGKPLKILPPSKCFGFPYQDDAYIQHLSPHLRDVNSILDFGLNFKMFFEVFYHLGPLRDPPKRHYTWYGTKPRDVGQRGEKTIDSILASNDAAKRYSPKERSKSNTIEELIAHWLKKFRLGDSFRVRSVDPEGQGNLYQVCLRSDSKAVEVPITDAGDGVSQVIPVIALCYNAPDYSTVVLEHPELHLHPSAQEDLADMLIDAVKRKNIQLIVESHSEHMFLRLQRRIAEAEKLTSDDVSLFFCRNDGTNSKLDPLNMDEYGMISNWPKEFFGDDFREIAATHDAMHKRQSKA